MQTIHPFPRLVVRIFPRNYLCGVLVQNLSTSFRRTSRRYPKYISRVKKHFPVHIASIRRICLMRTTCAYFDKCNNLNGHGHNYVLEVNVVGDIDIHTGMVMNIADLKYVIQEHVLKFIDHKHLDKDVDHFRTTDTVSTTESLAVFTWAKVVRSRSPSRPPKVGLSCPWQTSKVFSLPVPADTFPRLGAGCLWFSSACLAWPGLYKPVYGFIYWYYMIIEWNLRVTSYTTSHGCDQSIWLHITIHLLATHS